MAEQRPLFDDFQYELPRVDEAAPAEAEQEEPAEQKDKLTELDRKQQTSLFDAGEWWHEHWKQMPEFDQRNIMPWKTIYVHFESREHLDNFSKLVKQRIGIDTKFIWFPEPDIAMLMTKRYIDCGPGPKK